jgi:TM2 domain-containing membrane protein YozV
VTEPTDPYRSVDPTAPGFPAAPAQLPPPAEPETNVWSRPDAFQSGPPVFDPPVSGPPGYPVTLPVPYPPAPAAYPTADYPLVQPYPPNQPYQPQPYIVTGMVGYGVDPFTGQQLSSKSKVVAGLLQLLPGFMFGLGGIGRLYAGNTMLGVLQLVATLVGWVSFWCGFVLILPFFIYGAIWLWFVIDGIVLLAGRPRDGQGWLLRP